jgi:hypothetical protein
MRGTPWFLLLSLVGAASARGQDLPPSIVGATQNGDVNGDGKIDLSDSIYLMNYQFLGGPPPVPLFACEPQMSTADVLDFANMEVVGTSTLMRTSEGITARYETSVVPPGHVATLWWVIFNNPEDCQTGTMGACGSPDLRDPMVLSDSMMGMGNVADANGHVEIIAHLSVGEMRESRNAGFDKEPTGLLNPLGAEAHLVVRTHGPLVAEHAAEALNSFGGGCTTSLAPPERGGGEGECVNLAFAIHRD